MRRSTHDRGGLICLWIKLVQELVRSIKCKINTCGSELTEGFIAVGATYCYHTCFTVASTPCRRTADSLVGENARTARGC